MDTIFIMRMDDLTIKGVKSFMLQRLQNHCNCDVN